MKSLDELIRLNKTIRTMGFDDAPFDHERGSPVNLSGIVCAGTRFEGMVWGEVRKDGDDATARVIELVMGSKFHDQLHVVLLDGLAFGGFNLVDLPALAEALDRPCVAVMRRPPDMEAIGRALAHFDDEQRRLELIARAGPVHEADPFFFQVAGAPPQDVPPVLAQLTDQGHVPEALRLAHLIGAAIKRGESSSRA